MQITKTLYVKNRKEWREWLEKNYDKERDIWNNWYQCNRVNSWSKYKPPQEVIKICKDKKLEECKEDLNVYLSKAYNSKIINLDVKLLQEAWDSISDEFFERMDKLMKNKFDKDIIAYLTTLGICPYDQDEPSFMFSLFYSLPHQLKTCGHEIMHLYFHQFYWERVEDKIGKEKTGDLKEALSVLLNVEFRDLWIVEDTGYETHKELRDFIVDNWIKEKDFDILISKCIDYLK